jgi:hypothetical protein
MKLVITIDSIGKNLKIKFRIVKHRIAILIARVRETCGDPEIDGNRLFRLITMKRACSIQSLS